MLDPPSCKLKGSLIKVTGLINKHADYNITFKFNALYKFVTYYHRSVYKDQKNFTHSSFEFKYKVTIKYCLKHTLTQYCCLNGVKLISKITKPVCIDGENLKKTFQVYDTDILP